MDTTKQVIVLRKDLNMRKGKMAAQASHASMAAIFSREEMVATKTDDGIHVGRVITKEQYDWFLNFSVKIVVGVNSEEELLNLYQKAKQLGLPCSLIQDAGLTEFGGVKTYTAIGIGPAKSSLIDPLTRHLSLL